MFKRCIVAATMALACTIGTGTSAQAAPLIAVHNYGAQPGLDAPVRGGGGTMAPNHVTVIAAPDTSGNRFYDEIDFDTAAFGAIQSLTLTLSIARAGDSGEDWRVYGSHNGGTGAADQVQLGTSLRNGSSWTVTLTSGAVFDQAVAAGRFGFWFGDLARPGRWPNEFWLYSASLAVDGTPPSPVPLPAAGLLLIGSMGGLSLVRRRGRAAAG